MTKKEFYLIASAIRTYYPKENILSNDKALELWYKQLNDIPYELAEIVVNKWVATNKWSPTIADIREQAADLISGERKDWGEAWREVLRSIGRYGSYDVDNGLKCLDEVTRKVVKQLGYINLCMSEDLSRDRANFRMMYEAELEKQKQREALPPSLLKLIQNMPNMKVLEGGEYEE